MVNFMRAALNEHRKYNGLEPVSASDFLKLMREKRAVVEMDNKLSSRSVNEGFSGGEKKKAEILQLLMLRPTLAILDETRLAIVGFRPTNCLPCHLLQERFLNEDSGAWQYELTVQTETQQVQVHQPETKPLFTRTRPRESGDPHEQDLKLKEAP